MNIFFLIIRSTFILLCILSFVSGCGNKEEELTETTNVISRKVKDKQNFVQTKTPSDLKTVISSKPVASKQVAPSQLPLPDNKISKKADIYDQVIPYMEKDEASPDVTPLVRTYNPEGKLDPFIPLFQDKPDVRRITATNKRKRAIPRSPLEKIHLSQLTLTAIIMTSSGNKAMVEEASGKGHVIEKGTLIGTKWGKVFEIQKDTVLVHEEEENVLGEITVKRKEMKLQKPFGED